jgi:hypothetical protein
MNKRGLSDAQKLDEQLAAFTDQVLSKDEVVEMMEDSSQQDEFIKLQKAVLRIKSATQKAYPGVDTRERIRNHLLAEWEAGNKLKVSAFKDRFGLQKFPAITLAGGFAFVVLLGFLLIFWPLPEYMPLGATAGDGPVSLIPFFVFMGVAAVAIILWFRHKR